MRRLRKFIIITGTLLCVLIAAALVVSARWSIHWCRHPGMWLGISGGTLMFVTDAEFLRQMVEWGPFGEGLSVHGHEFQISRGPVSLSSPFKIVPLWMPLLAVAVPTPLVWRFGRKPVKPGHCRCGYDLTGNTSGVCPECGAEVQR